MKKLLLLLFLCVFQAASAQNAPDKITKKDKTTIDAVVLEISKNEIQYKKFSSPKGATFTVPTTEVANIVYASGYIDVMDADNSPVASPVVKSTTLEPKAAATEPVAKADEPATKQTPQPEAQPVAEAGKKAKREKKEKKEKKPKGENDFKFGDAQKNSGEATAASDESKTTVTKLDGKQESIVLPSSDFTGLDIEKLPKTGLDKDERLPAEYAGEYQWKSSDKGGRETAWLFEWDNVTLVVKEWMGYGWRVHASDPKDIKLSGNKLTVKKKPMGEFVRFGRGGQEIRGFRPELDKKARKAGKPDLFLIKVS